MRRLFLDPFCVVGRPKMGAGVRRMGSHLTWPHGPPVSKAFFGPFLCAKAFFGPFLCGGTFQKKPWQWGGRCSVFWSGFFSRPFWNNPLFRRMGSRLTWPHGPPVSKAFFGPFLCVKAFFGPFLCGGTFQKKPWQWGGRCSGFWSSFFQTFLE